eukprot:1063723-Amorphochlora_amoeboformis.AAC.1
MFIGVHDVHELLTGRVMDADGFTTRLDVSASLGSAILDLQPPLHHPAFIPCFKGTHSSIVCLLNSFTFIYLRIFAAL